ncbi:MAG: glycosyltransferase family 4 protein [Acidimicrobiaceae bacterium]|nr:glycosyltransferase family 4 protein [Acidimicrobiaceae bacterium]
MRIGIVCPYSLTVPGGVQMQVLGLARALSRSGHPTRVLGPCDGPPPDPNVTPLGNSLPTIANGSIAPVAPDPSCQLRAIRAMRDESFDVIHLHEPLAPGPTMTALLVRPAPLIGTFHAAGGSLAYDLLPRATRFLAGRLDLRVAVSPDARDMARNALGGSYDLLYNGVELAPYRVAEPARSPGPTILFIGRHEPRKGLGVLLDALRMLPTDVRLQIAGSGSETAALQARSASDPRIEWLGTVTDSEKIARLKGADVFCAPSLRGESFGIVLLEAMAAGTAVVASDLPGYRNVARPGQDALLVPPGDSEKLALALHRVLSDTSESLRLVAEGHRRAEAFSMSGLADQYLERYERIAVSTSRAKRPVG